MNNERLDIDLSQSSPEGMEQFSERLSDLRTRYQSISSGQQEYFNQDGNLERWTADMGDLQMKIGATIANIENAGGSATLNSDEERVWADRAKELMG